MDLDKLRAVEEARRLREQFDPVQDVIEKQRRIEEALGPAEKILREQRAINELIGPKQALRQIIEDPPGMKRLRDQIAGTAIRMSPTDEAYRKLIGEGATGFQNQIHSILVQTSKAVSLSAIETLKGAQMDSVALIGMKGFSKVWAEQLGHVAASARENILGLHFNRISDLSVLAQSSLTRVAEEAVRNSVKSVLDAASMKDSLVGFSQSYSHLLESFERSQAKFFALPPILSRLPAVEFFNDADLFEVTSIESEEDDENADKRITAREEIRNETFDALDSLLYAFNPELMKMRDGARMALKSDNPDRIRHFTASYRELFTHVLHLLSPDDELGRWSDKKEHFANGRPTRKARMLFICRHINQPPFDDFVQKDISAALSVIDFFQQGTHQITCAYTPTQIAAIEVRMEATLRFLLEIKKAEEQVH